ncbi:hypothetical protein ACNFBR_10485 [Pseudomonas sp. NY11955]|uniref:hypothetical protein n=1 Tax=Pseudomonas sp. NY11955 TaxID=3400363 RepID=UPI003A88ECFF
MPTEYRSCSNDPRDLFISLNPLGLDEKCLIKNSTGFEDQRTHNDYLLFLAGSRESHPDPQPHPEPIAWMVGTALGGPKKRRRGMRRRLGFRLSLLGRWYPSLTDTA